MLTITFDEYDKIDSLAEEMEAPEDFPDIEDIPRALSSMAGLLTCLRAYHHSDDEEYRRQINRYMKEHLEFVDDETEEEPEEVRAGSEFRVLSGKEIDKINRYFSENPEVEYPQYIPTLNELKASIRYHDETDIAFLIFIYRIGIFNDNEKERTKKYLENLFSQIDPEHSLDLTPLKVQY